MRRVGDFFGDSRLLSPFPGVTYTLDVRYARSGLAGLTFARNNAKRGYRHLFPLFASTSSGKADGRGIYGTFFVLVSNKQVSLNTSYGDKATMPSRFGVTTGLICPQNYPLHPLVLSVLQEVSAMSSLGVFCADAPRGRR